MFPRFFLALLVTFIFCAAASAAEPRLLTPQNLWAIKRVGTPALSPDGRHAVFPVEEWSIKKNKNEQPLDGRSGRPRSDVRARCRSKEPSSALIQPS